MSKLKKLLKTKTEREARLVADDIAEDIVAPAVNPASIPEAMTQEQLQWWILFTIAVAGKPAKMIEAKMREFMDLDPHYAPFDKVRSMVMKGKLDRNLRKVRIGKYLLLNSGFRAAIQIDVAELAAMEPAAALAALMKVPGLGPKGSRMILMYAFPEQANLWAVLDTHVLRWLREQGHDAPRSTPSGKKYLQLEEVFRLKARRLRMTMRELDTRIWNTYSKISGDPSQGF